MNFVFPTLTATAFILLVFPARAFENLVQAKGEVRKDQLARPLPFAQPDWNLYHRTDNLTRLLNHLAADCPAASLTLRVATPGDSLSAGGAGHPAGPGTSNQLTLPTSAADGLLYAVLTARSVSEGDSLHDPTNPIAPHPARRLADGIFGRRPTSSSALTTLVYTFGAEGRDLITSEIALTVLQAVCTNHIPLPPRVRLVIVPVSNPDGRRIAEMGRRCDRANANDVDIDRNWPTFWGIEPVAPPQPPPMPPVPPGPRLRVAVSRHLRDGTASTNTRSSITNTPAAGSHPLSEPETRSLKAILEHFKPSAFISFRTGALSITGSGDCRPDGTAITDEEIRRISAPITIMHCPRCTTGTLWTTSRQMRCGTAVDFAANVLRIPLTQTWAVYHGAPDTCSVSPGDCFRAHNPVSATAFTRVSRNWAYAVLRFATVVRDWAQTKHEAGEEVALLNVSLAAASAARAHKLVVTEGGPVDPTLAECEIDIATSKAAKEMMRRSDEQGDGVHDRRRDGLLKWMFSNESNVAMSGKVGSRGSLDRETSGEDPRVAALTGWMGVWAGLLLLGVCLAVAKRYVFRARPRKRSFLNRAPMKSA